MANQIPPALRDGMMRAPGRDLQIFFILFKPMFQPQRSVRLQKIPAEILQKHRCVTVNFRFSGTQKGNPDQD